MGKLVKLAKPPPHKCYPLVRLFNARQYLGACARCKALEKLKKATVRGSKIRGRARRIERKVERKLKVV